MPPPPQWFAARPPTTFMPGVLSSAVRVRLVLRSAVRQIGRVCVGAVFEAEKERRVQRGQQGAGGLLQPSQQRAANRRVAPTELKGLSSHRQGHRQPRKTLSKSSRGHIVSLLQTAFNTRPTLEYPTVWGASWPDSPVRVPGSPAYSTVLARRSRGRVTPDIHVPSTHRSPPGCGLEHPILRAPALSSFSVQNPSPELLRF